MWSPARDRYITNQQLVFLFQHSALNTLKKREKKGQNCLQNYPQDKDAWTIKSCQVIKIQLWKPLNLIRFNITLHKEYILEKLKWFIVFVTI